MNPAALARALNITPQEAAALIAEQGLDPRLAQGQSQLDRAMDGPARRLPGPEQIADISPGERLLDWAGEANPVGFADDLVRQSSANELAEALLPFGDTLPAAMDLREGWDDPAERDYQSARLGMSLAGGLLDFLPGMGITDNALRDAARPRIPNDFEYRPPEDSVIALPDRSRERLVQEPAAVPWSFDHTRVFDESGGFAPFRDYSPALSDMYSPSGRLLLEGDVPRQASGIEWSQLLDARHRKGEGRLNNEARFTGLDSLLSEYADRTLSRNNLLEALASGYQDAGRLRRSHETQWAHEQPPLGYNGLANNIRPEGSQLITQSTDNWGQTHWPNTPGGLMHYRSWDMPGEGRLVREIQADTLRAPRHAMTPAQGSLAQEYLAVDREMELLRDQLPPDALIYTTPWGMRLGETVEEAFHRAGRVVQEDPYNPGPSNSLSRAFANPLLREYYNLLNQRDLIANRLAEQGVTGINLHDFMSTDATPLHTGSQDVATRFLANRSILDALADEKPAVNFPSTWEQLHTTHGLEPGVLYEGGMGNLQRSFTRHYGRDVPSAVSRAAQELGTEVQSRPSSGIQPWLLQDNERYFEKSPSHYSRRYGIDLNEDVLLQALTRGLPVF